MSYRPKLQLNPPSNWADFETLCWGLWKTIWRDSETQKHGRLGQPQHGVDVFGQPESGDAWAGVQCKGKEQFTNQRLTRKEINAEIRKATKFTPALSGYTIATTAPRDAEIQKHVRRLRCRMQKLGRFRFSVCAWDDIEELIYEHEPPIARSFYPAVFGELTAGFTKQLLHVLSELHTVRTRESQPAKYVAESHVPRNGNAPVEHMTTDRQIAVPTDVASAPEDDVCARDVGLVVQKLSQMEREFLQVSQSGGTSSADTQLAAAVKRAIEDGKGRCDG